MITPRVTGCYCINMRRAANALTGFYDKEMEPVNLTISQFSLLNDIKMLGFCNKSQLAQYAKLDRTTVIRNLSTLNKRGYTAHVAGSGQHKNFIQLTEAGESIIAEGAQLWKQAQKKLEHIVGIENLEDLKRILNFMELLEEAEGFAKD